MKNGSLIIVGSGIKSIGHLTLEACGWIRRADIVLYCAADPATEIWIKKNNPNHLDLYQFYKDDGNRIATYQAMTDCILAHVRSRKDVCVVYYGHPGVFVTPTHDAVRLAMSEGYKVAMLPGISAEDYLFAEVGFDPSVHGCMAYEATDLLLRRRLISAESHVIIWQIGCLGDFTFRRTGYDTPYLSVLTEYLLEYYDHDHEAVHYQGAQYPVCKSYIEKIKIGCLDRYKFNGISTLCIPPQALKSIDAEMAKRLGIEDLSALEKSDATPNNEVTLSPRAVSPHYVPTPVQSNLADFLEELSTDPMVLAEYNRNPDMAMALYSDALSDVERTALLNRQSGMIHLALKGQALP